MSVNLRIICYRADEVFTVYGVETEIICPGCHEPVSFDAELGVLRGNGTADHEIDRVSDLGSDVLRDFTA